MYPHGKATPTLFKVYLRGAGRSRAIPYLSRKVTKDPSGKAENHIDEYEIKVRPGPYRLNFPEFPKYKFANFIVGAGEVVLFRIPEWRFVTMLCHDDRRILKTYSSETPLRVQEREYSRPPYSKIRTEVVKVDRRFDLVISHCGREKRGQNIHYKDAEAYYKNYFVAAPTIILSKATLRLEGTGREDKVLVELNGVEVEIPTVGIRLK